MDRTEQNRETITIKEYSIAAGCSESYAHKKWRSLKEKGSPLIVEADGKHLFVADILNTRTERQPVGAEPTVQNNTTKKTELNHTVQNLENQLAEAIKRAEAAEKDAAWLRETMEKNEERAAKEKEDLRRLLDQEQQLHAATQARLDRLLPAPNAEPKHDHNEAKKDPERAADDLSHGRKSLIARLFKK